MPHKPANLIYGVDDKPPLIITALAAAQHIAVAVVHLAFPLLLIKEMAGGAEQTQALVSMSMLAMGLSSLLQCWGGRGLGSGFMAPHNSNPVYMSVSAMAVQRGGLGLLFGMMLFAGALQGVLAKAMSRLRPLFPPEVCGVVVAMTGLSLVKVSLLSLVGVDDDQATFGGRDMAVGLATLLTMIGLTVWSKGRLKLFAVLAGMIVGYAAAAALGVFDSESLAKLDQSPLFALPAPPSLSLSFDPELALPFIVAMLASALKASGIVVSSQKINDADWKRADMQSVGGGVMADAIGVFSAGALGGYAPAVSSASAGVVMATGAAARPIGYFYGFSFLALAFLPKASAVLALMPTPVMGAGLLYAACFLVVNGADLILSRMLDSRRTFVVGLSIVLGLSADIVPELFCGLPSWARPIFSSSMTLATITALVTNLIFRLGVRQTEQLELDPAQSKPDDIYRFMETNGGAWGALPSVIHRATSAITELFESLVGLDLAKGAVLVTAKFDEFNLDVDVSYRGQQMRFPLQRPAYEDIVHDDRALADLSGYLVRQYVDKISPTSQGEAHNVRLHFDH